MQLSRSIERTLVVLLGLAAASAGQQFPHLQEESLAGQQIVLPEGVQGKVAVLVLGFSKASSTPTGAWAKRVQQEFGRDSGFVLYQLAVIEEAPKFIRGMIISGMKSGMTDTQRAYVVPVVHQEEELKNLVNFKEADDAYVVVLDRRGKISYQTHAAAVDPAYAELRTKVQSLLK
jgi:hypothetical protein